MNTQRLYQSIVDELTQVDEMISGLRDDRFPFLSKLINHVFDVPGKRIRPAITLLSSKFYSCDPAPPIVMAVAIELLHIATLIHDDTIDNSNTRHGRVTVSSQWGQNVAVLLGDYMFASSATFVCDTGNIRVIRRFSETIMELSSGELYEIASSYDLNQTRKQYWERVCKKTASLFQTASESGGILSGAPEKHVQALKEFGVNIGMAFQIVDDILDFEGNPEEVGKPVGNDLLQGTLTLPAFILMERYPNNNPIIPLFENIDKEKNLKRALEMIQNSTIIQDSYTVARYFCQNAVNAIDTLPDTKYRNALTDIASYLLERRT